VKKSLCLKDLKSKDQNQAKDFSKIMKLKSHDRKKKSEKLRWSLTQTPSFSPLIFHCSLGEGQAEASGDGQGKFDNMCSLF